MTSKKNSWGITNYWNQSIKAVAWRCSVKKVFLEISQVFLKKSQNSQENFLSGVHSFCVRLKVYSLDFNDEGLHWYLKKFFSTL